MHKVIHVHSSFITQQHKLIYMVFTSHQYGGDTMAVNKRKDV